MQGFFALCCHVAAIIATAHLSTVSSPLMTSPPHQVAVSPYVTPGTLEKVKGKVSSYIVSNPQDCSRCFYPLQTCSISGNRPAMLQIKD